MQHGWSYGQGLIAIAVLVFGLSLPELGLGSSFEVSPIRLSFQPTESSALMTVRNEGDEKLRLQISVMAWDQRKDGEMVLTPTDEIIFYPTLLTVDPGAQRNLRVGTKGNAVAKEQSYRIFVEELPSNVRLQVSGVRIVTKMSIPIFIKPAKSEMRNVIDRIALRGSDVTFDVKNLGNVHIQPREVRVKGTSADGNVQLDRKIPGWYILAGGLREYRIDVPKGGCSKIKDLSIEVDMDPQPLKEIYSVPAGACSW
jgi:fimbrial chaperone protein